MLSDEVAYDGAWCRDARYEYLLAVSTRTVHRGTLQRHARRTFPRSMRRRIVCNRDLA